MNDSLPRRTGDICGCDRSVQQNRPKLLIAFSKDHRWKEHLVRKFSVRYSVEVMLAEPIFRAGGSAALEREIGNQLRSKSINILLIDSEFLPLVDSLAISSIPDGVLRVLLAFDDVLQHEINLYHALQCHAVLSADPVSVSRFRQRGVPAHLICLEASRQLYFPAQDHAEKAEVLFFGDPTRGDRPLWLAHLAKHGITVTTPGPGLVSYEKLAEQIRNSKIVLNLAKVVGTPFSPLIHHETAPFLYFKGRIVEAGLCGAACISEWFPGSDEMFGPDALPCFTTPEECVDLIRRLLSDESRRLHHAEALHKHCMANYEDEAQMASISRFLGLIRPSARHFVPASSAYCAHLLARKVLRAIAISPVLVAKETFRLISRRIVGKGIARNLFLVSLLIPVVAVSMAIHVATTRKSK